jgi:thiol-disulfide isomerase/thioredoxin
MTEVDTKSRKPNPAIRAVLDVLCGFVAFATVLLVSFITREHQDVRSFLLAVCVAFFVVGYLRARVRSGRLALQFLFVVIGAIAPAIALKELHIAFTASPFLQMYVILGSLAAAVGMIMRWLTSRGKALYGVVLGCLAAIAASVIIFKTVPEWMERKAYVQVRQEISPFSIQTLDGKTIPANELQGHVVVLAFWATWCTPCQQELPKIAAVQDQYRNNPNVLIFAVNSGNHGETPEKARAYLSRKHLDLKGAIDPPVSDDDSWGLAARSLGTTSLPVIYILDRSGTLRVIHSGYDSSEDLSASLFQQVHDLL